MIPVCFQGKLFNITVIQRYAPIINVEEAEVDQFYEKNYKTSRTNTKTRCTFHPSRLKFKSRKSKDT